MLKLISSSCLQSRIYRLTPSLLPAWPGTDADSDLFEVLNSLRLLEWRDPNLGETVFFCWDTSDGSESDQVVEAEDKATESGACEADSKATSIVSANPRPEDFHTALALPLLHKSLFPGFYMPIYVKCMNGYD